jgi:hypothetical protein
MFKQGAGCVLVREGDYAWRANMNSVRIEVVARRVNDNLECVNDRMYLQMPGYGSIPAFMRIFGHANVPTFENTLFDWKAVPQ